MSFNVEDFRRQFPILERKINGHPLIYFDSGASSLKPRKVADAIHHYYLYETANIHRGAHTMSREGTEKYEAVRGKIQKFIGARESSEIIFTRGVTESLNLLSYTLGLSIKSGDVILLSPLEHHSNILPWKILCERTGARIELLPFEQDGSISAEDLAKAFTPSVKIVSLLMYSNVTGVRLDVEKVVEKAKTSGALSIIDAAQAMLHEKINVQALGCDYLTFSSHKMLGPYGVGVLFGKKERLLDLPPFHGGGSMISSVDWENTVYQDAPHKFEAGTPSIADVIGLGAAIDVIVENSLEDWKKHGREIITYLETELSRFKKIKLLGATVQTAPRKADIISFSYEGAHASDVGELLDQMGVAVRAGHHCAQPLMAQLGVSGTVRISLAPYNTLAEAQEFIRCLRKVEDML